MRYKQTFSKVLEEQLRDITSLGGFSFFALVSLFFLILGELRIFLFLFLGGLLTGLITALIRGIYFKKRPHAQNYGNFLEKLDASSFPSWHSSRVSFLSFFLTQELTFPLALDIFIFALALLVIYSRVHLKRHDVFDVSIGALLGILLFYLLRLAF